LKYERYYLKEITNESYKELIEYSRWMNKKLGNYPMIIGGWAVYFYCKGVGSRDIDTVFPNRDMKHYVLKHYFESHNYKEEGIFVKEFFKEINVRNKILRVYLDACSVEDRNYLRIDPNIEIPWNLCFRYNTLKEIADDTHVYLPDPEILFLYKSASFIDREHKLKIADSSARAYISHKVWKDAYDLETLISGGLDKSIVSKLARKLGFEKYLKTIEKKLEIYL